MFDLVEIVLLLHFIHEYEEEKALGMAARSR